MKNIGECLASNIKAVRKDRKITQEKLAESTGLSLAAIQLIETRKRWPGRETIAAIAKALGVPETRLFLDPSATTGKPSVQEAWDTITEELKPKLTGGRGKRRK